MKFLKQIFSTGGTVEASALEPMIQDFAPEYTLGAIVIKPEWDGTFGLYIKRLRYQLVPTSYGFRMNSFYELSSLTEQRFESVESAQQRLTHMDSAPFVIPPSEDA